MEREAAEELLLEALGKCAAYAGERGVGIALEPINRYETNLIHSVDQGLELLEKLQSAHAGLLLDTFHMNIEETNIEKSILKAKGESATFISQTATGLHRAGDTWTLDPSCAACGRPATTDTSPVKPTTRPMLCPLLSKPMIICG